MLRTVSTDINNQYWGPYQLISTTDAEDRINWYQQPIFRAISTDINNQYWGPYQLILTTDAEDRINWYQQPILRNGKFDAPVDVPSQSAVDLVSPPHPSSLRRGPSGTWEPGDERESQETDTHLSDVQHSLQLFCISAKVNGCSVLMYLPSSLPRHFSQRI